MCISCVCMLSCSVVPDSLQPHGLQPIIFLCPWRFSRREYRSGYSKGTSKPKDRALVTGIASIFFTIRATGEAHIMKRIKNSSQLFILSIRILYWIEKNTKFLQRQKKNLQRIKYVNHHCFHTDLVFCTLELTKNITDTSFSD